MKLVFRVIIAGTGLVAVGELLLYAYFARHGIYPFEHYDLGLLSLFPVALTVSLSIVINAFLAWGWVYLFAARTNGEELGRFNWMIVIIVNCSYQIFLIDKMLPRLLREGIFNAASVMNFAMTEVVLFSIAALTVSAKLKGSAGEPAQIWFQRNMTLIIVAALAFVPGLGISEAFTVTALRYFGIGGGLKVGVHRKGHHYRSV